MYIEFENQSFEKNDFDFFKQHCVLQINKINF